jgi:hypothetical protein
MDRGDNASHPVQNAQRDRKPWVRPELRDLPKLTDLTLQTGSPIVGGGGTGGGGSTVF